MIQLLYLLTAVTYNVYRLLQCCVSLTTTTACSYILCVDRCSAQYICYGTSHCHTSDVIYNLLCNCSLCQITKKRLRLRMARNSQFSDAISTNENLWNLAQAINCVAVDTRWPILIGAGATLRQKVVVFYVSGVINSYFTHDRSSRSCCQGSCLGLRWCTSYFFENLQRLFGNVVKYTRIAISFWWTTICQQSNGGTVFLIALIFVQLVVHIKIQKQI